MVNAPIAPPAPGCFWLDPRIASLLVMPPHTELHAHGLVAALLILQDRLRLAPAALARPGELVSIAVHARNKATQLAALTAPDGRVIACEHDARRAERAQAAL